MSDPVDHPDHYKFDGVEVIQLTEQLNFNRGNAVKYVARAGRKDPATELEDLRKAKFYLEREINRFDNPPTYNVVDWDEFWQDIDVSIAEAGTYRPVPRVWDFLNLVPHGVQVTDKWGDVWTHKLGVWGFDLNGDGDWLKADFPPERYDHQCAPFTEILDAK